MSNPNINRWGLNLFWNRLWYKDKNYALALHQDNIFAKLIIIYLNYGILYPTNIFAHKFWYFNKFFKTKNHFIEHNTKYYRLMSFKNLTMGINELYSVRVKTKNLYTGRVWLFRYQNWLIINFYCFQPIKKKPMKKSTNISKKKTLDFYFTENGADNILIKRLKFILIYIWSVNYNANTTYYNF